MSDADKRGGEFRIAFPTTDAGDARSLDPQIDGATYANTITAVIYDSLVYQDPSDNSIKPGLAERWEASDDGTVYKIKVHEVPDAAASARGKAIVNLISMPSDRKLAGVVPVRDFEEGRYVLMVTRKGVIKKTSLADFKNIRSNGINAINIDEGDQLLDVVLTDVAEAGSAEQRITDRMDQHIRITMADRTAVRRDLNTSQPKRPSLRQLMKIYSKAYTHNKNGPGEKPGPPKDI